MIQFLKPQLIIGALFFLFPLCATAQESDSPTEIVRKAAAYTYQLDKQSLAPLQFEKPSNWQLIKHVKKNAILLQPLANKGGIAFLMIECQAQEECSDRAILEKLAIDLKPEAEKSQTLQRFELKSTRYSARFINGESAEFITAKFTFQTKTWLAIAGAKTHYFFPHLLVFYRILSSFDNAKVE